jgi:hypothetical protein
MELASIIKPSLKPAPVTALLLKNVADTLGDWDFALGLAASLYPDISSFINVARAFEPEPQFAEQYNLRIDHVEKCGFALVHYRPGQVEIKGRRRIMAVAFDWPDKRATVTCNRDMGI